MFIFLTFSIQEFDDITSEEFSYAHKSQLKLYLDEPKMSRNVNFDVLTFWKSHQYCYPKLAAMARDVLSILVSTVASEATFSVGRRARSISRFTQTRKY